MGDEVTDVAVAQELPDAGRWRARIDRHEGGAGLEDAVDGDRRIEAAGQEDADPVTAAGSFLDEQVRQPIGADRGVAVAQPERAVAQRFTLRPGLGGAVQEVWQEASEGHLSTQSSVWPAAIAAALVLAVAGDAGSCLAKR